jgi:hypothetical protein
MNDFIASNFGEDSGAGVQQGGNALKRVDVFYPLGWPKYQTEMRKNRPYGKRLFSQNAAG